MKIIEREFPLNAQWPTQDPFVFCAYHSDNYPGANKEQGPKVSLSDRNIGQDFSNKEGWSMYHGDRVPGFPAHPHCGFETITLVSEGYVDHADSMGSSGRFGEGDAQWMTAGKGVLHSEMFPLLDPIKNPLQLFQLWLNLPEKNRDVEPHYKIFAKDDIPVVEKNNAKITIIAGHYSGVPALSPSPNSWAADPRNEIQIWKIDLDTEGHFEIPETDSSINRSLFFFKGDSVFIEDTKVDARFGFELSSEKKIEVRNESKKKASLIFLQGRPIAEPFIVNGPFIAANRAQMHKAISEYQRSQFGGWKWDSPGPVFGPEKKRFSSQG